LKYDLCFGLKNSGANTCSLDATVKPYTTTFFSMINATTMTGVQGTHTTIRDDYKWTGACGDATAVLQCRTMKTNMGTKAAAGDLATAALWLANEDNSAIHQITYEAKSIGNTQANTIVDKGTLVNTLITNTATATYNVGITVAQAKANALNANTNTHTVRWTVNTFGTGVIGQTDKSSTDDHSHGWTNINLVDQDV